MNHNIQKHSLISSPPSQHVVHEFVSSQEDTRATPPFLRSPDGSVPCPFWLPLHEPLFRTTKKAMASLKKFYQDDSEGRASDSESGS